MYTSRPQALLDTVRSKFRKTETSEKEDSQEIEQLAEQIMEYGRMIHNESPHQRLFVNVTEVARRFREDRQRVIKALVLLRTQGRADRTARREDWKLNI
jgi:phage-related minor tail protein